MRRGYKKRGRPRIKPLLKKKRGRPPLHRNKRKYVYKTKHTYRRKKCVPKKQRETKRQLSESIIRSRDLNHYYSEAGDWLILELYDDVDLGGLFNNIENDILNIFGEATDYFIPVYSEKVREKCVCINLFDGYVFVKESDTTEDSLSKMKSEYIKGTLSGPKGLLKVKNENINSFKKKLEHKIKGMVPTKGQRVIPRVGTFKNMEGKVISVNKTKLIARVLFEKSSRVVEAPISVVNLDIV